MLLLKICLLFIFFNEVKLYNIFPVVDDFEQECQFKDGTPGMCRNIKYCPTALTAKELPQICNYEQFDQIVCCSENKLDNHKNWISTKRCAQYYLNGKEIVGGVPTETQEFPYMVGLGWESKYENGVYDYKCGGVLVSNKYILTAAHCGYAHGNPPAVGLPGGLTISAESANETLKIGKIILHPDYEPLGDYNDIALLELVEPYEKARPICLWTNYALEEINVTVIGYGHTSFGGEPSQELLKTNILVLPNRKCSLSYFNVDYLPKGIMETQFCAGDAGERKDTCQGDSGGPVIMRVAEKPFLIGITSLGQSCGTHIPSVYTRVSEYIQWIEGIVWKYE